MPAPSEAVKPSHSSSAGGDNPKQLDQGIKEMVSMLTDRLVHLPRGHKFGLSNHEAGENQTTAADEGGVRIITLAGTNTGATMRSELDDGSFTVPHHSNGLSSPNEEPDSLATYVNSNFQAINNSIMLGGSHHFKDPGVHMDISEPLDDEDHFQHRHHKDHPLNKHAAIGSPGSDHHPKRQAKRGKNKDVGGMESPVSKHYLASD